jgi:hypothetical protein
VNSKSNRKSLPNADTLFNSLLGTYRLAIGGKSSAEGTAADNGVGGVEHPWAGRRNEDGLAAERRMTGVRGGGIAADLDVVRDLCRDK